MCRFDLPIKNEAIWQYDDGRRSIISDHALYMNTLLGNGKLYPSEAHFSQSVKFPQQTRQNGWELVKTFFSRNFSINRRKTGVEYQHALKLVVEMFTLSSTLWFYACRLHLCSYIHAVETQQNRRQVPSMTRYFGKIAGRFVSCLLSV